MNLAFDEKASPRVSFTEPLLKLFMNVDFSLEEKEYCFSELYVFQILALVWDSNYLHTLFSSPDVTFNAIKRLITKAEKFSNHKARREKDKEWIERKLKEEGFFSIRDISQSTPKSTPTKDSSPLSPKRIIEDEVSEFGRGKRIKFHKSTCNLECCTIPRALFIDDVMEIVSDLEISQVAEDDDEAVPDDGDPDYIDESLPKLKPVPKTPRPNFETVLALQARFNTPDCQVALWWNIVSLAQGITDPRRLTCGSTIGNLRESQGEKIMCSHVQEFSGIYDMDFDGKQSQTAIGKKELCLKNL